MMHISLLWKKTKYKTIDKIMKNILSPVRNVRKSYCKFRDKIFTEVEVQFVDEDPAWIPYDTLIAIEKIYGNSRL